MVTAPERLAVSQVEAAAMVGISVRTLQYFIRSRQIPARKIGRRTLIEVRALKRFLSEDRASANTCGESKTLPRT